LPSRRGIGDPTWTKTLRTRFARLSLGGGALFRRLPLAPSGNPQLPLDSPTASASRQRDHEPCLPREKTARPLEIGHPILGVVRNCGRRRELSSLSCLQLELSSDGSQRLPAPVTNSTLGSPSKPRQPSRGEADGTPEAKQHVKLRLLQGAHSRGSMACARPHIRTTLARGRLSRFPIPHDHRTQSQGELEPLGSRSRICPRPRALPDGRGLACPCPCRCPRRRRSRSTSGVSGGVLPQAAVRGTSGAWSQEQRQEQGQRQLQLQLQLQLQRRPALPPHLDPLLRYLESPQRLTSVSAEKVYGRKSFCQAEVAR